MVGPRSNLKNQGKTRAGPTAGKGDEAIALILTAPPATNPGQRGCASGLCRVGPPPCAIGADGKVCRLQAALLRAIC